MTESSNGQQDPSGEKMTQKIEKCAERKIAARKEGNRSPWFGMGFFGMIGWSVAIPTLLGTVIGVWVDKKWASNYSWTLMLMFLGLIIGCLTAWRWIREENTRNK